MSKEQRATTPDLFQVCRRHFSQPVASVASELLFWSQCGQHTLHGRAGFYKEDADLVQAIGKNASSIRRALAPICAKVGEDRPEALFEIAHGPKPGQRSGRVQWLFRKPRGDEMIHEALRLAEVRRAVRSASTNRSGKARSVRRDWMDRSAQNELTLYQKNLSESHSETLSSEPDEREKPRFESLKKNSGEEEKERNAEKKETDREDLTRFVNHWNAICTECNESTLTWLPSDVEPLAGKLIEVIRHLGIPEMPDEELSKRLRLLCGKQSRPVFERMGAAFSKFNPHGLVITTFAKFGSNVWRAAEAELSKAAPKPRRNELLELAGRPREKPLTSEEKARELARLTKTWKKVASSEVAQPLNGAASPSIKILGGCSASSKQRA